MAFQPIPYLSRITSFTMGAVGSLSHNSPFDWKPPALGSVPRFHFGNCWQFGLLFRICLESFPRFHIGNRWWQLRFPIYLKSVCSFHLRSACSILSSSPKFHIGNCWWCTESLFLGQAAVICYCWSVKVHIFVCLVLCR